MTDEEALALPVGTKVRRRPEQCHYLPERIGEVVAAKHVTGWNGVRVHVLWPGNKRPWPTHAYHLEIAK